MMRRNQEKGKKVAFSLLAPHAKSVSLAGDFNDWNQMAHPMKKNKKGVWELSLILAPGTHQYNFFVDGEWQNDPTCIEHVENPFGTLNCLIKVG